MNTKTSAPWRNLFTFGWLALALFVGFLALTAIAQAQTVIPASQPAPAFNWATLLDPQFITGLLAVAGAIGTWWHQKQAKGYKAALGAVVVGVEKATAIPAVAAFEDQIKATIKATAQQHGCQGILSLAVDALTPAVEAEAANLTSTVPPAAPPQPASTSGRAFAGLMATLAALGLALALCVAGTGCATISKGISAVQAALTGHAAVLTVELAGSTVDSIMQGAAKAYHNGDITAAQWDTIAAIDVKFRAVYNPEVANIIASKASVASTLPSAELTSLLSQVITTAEALKLTTPATPPAPAPVKTSQAGAPAIQPIAFTFTPMSATATPAQ